MTSVRDTNLRSNSYNKLFPLIETSRIEEKEINNVVDGVVTSNNSALMSMVDMLIVQWVEFLL